jgi:hypothetical protein
MREGNEIDRRSLRKIGESFGFTIGIRALEHQGPSRFKPLMPGVEAFHLLWLEKELLDIQEQVSAEYAHCE